MHHTSGVDRTQRVGEITSKVGEVRPAQRPVPFHDLVERRSVHEVRDEVRGGGGHVGVEDLGDMPASHPGEHLCLSREPGPRLAVARDVRTKQLDRYNTTMGVRRPMDDPHPALADPLP